MIYFDPNRLTNIVSEDGFMTGVTKQQEGIGGRVIPANTRHYYFEGVGKVFEMIKKYYSNPANEGHSDTKGYYGGGFSLATSSFDEAVEVFTERPYSIINLDNFESKITDDSSRGNSVEYDIVGDFLDVSRYLEGIPETFGYNTQGKTEVQFVQFVVNIGWPHYVPKEYIETMARELTSTVQWLEDNNVRCSISTLEIGTCNSTEIRIKHFNERLNIVDLAIVSHNDFFRRIGFRLIEHSPTWDYGYGSSTPGENYLRNYNKQNGNFSTVVVGQNLGDTTRDFATLRQLLETNLKNKELLTYRVCQ